MISVVEASEGTALTVCKCLDADEQQYLRRSTGCFTTRFQYDNDLKAGHQQCLRRQFPQRARLVDVVNNLERPRQEEEVVAGLRSNAKVFLVESNVSVTLGRLAD